MVGRNCSRWLNLEGFIRAFELIDGCTRDSGQGCASQLVVSGRFHIVAVVLIVKDVNGKYKYFPSISCFQVLIFFKY